MLFMSVFTFSPDKRNEVIRRRQEGPKLSKGTKLIGEWAVIGKNMVYRLFETEDPKAMLDGTSSWTDIGDIHVDPVIDSEEMMNLFRGMKR